MQELRIGLDVDGVLANFNSAYREILIEVSGRDLIPEVFEPPCWEYAPAYGYTKDEDRAAWSAIRNDPFFWRKLGVLPGAQELLNDIDDVRHAVYFITTRLGTQVKHQTESWLRDYVANPAVLIAKSSADKGRLAEGLDLTHFVDDKPENCIAVKEAVPGCRVFLLSYAYNLWAKNEPRYDYLGITRIHNLNAFAEAIGRSERLAA